MFYVTMTDSCLSGWGMAKSKKNKLVIECETYEEALIVKEKADKRAEMKYVNISLKKPSYNKNKYLVSWHDKKTYPNWFKKGAF